MRLMHTYFSEPIKFLENNINILVVENPILFSKMIKGFLQQYNGEDGDFILSKNFEIIDIPTNIEIITDVFNLDFNNRKIINKVYTLLQNASVNEIFEDSQNLYNNINEYLSKIVQYCDYPLHYNSNIDLINIFKSCDLKIDISNSNILEEIVNYILLYKNIFNVELFVFVNLKCVLSKAQLLELYKTILYQKINILLIESNVKDVLKQYENLRIIDNDMCEIY